MLRNARRIAALAVVVTALPAASAAGATTAGSGSTGPEQTSPGITFEAEPTGIALLLPAVQKIREAAR